jgi:hypothetical protein
MSEFLSQGDERWRLKRINGTTSTLLSYGCLITDICWLLNQAGYQITPDELATKSELFDGAYWNGWTKLESLFPKMKYVWGERCTDYPAPVDKIIKELDDGFYPVIMLDYAPKTNGLQTHCLTVLGHDDKGNLKVGDPIDGQIVWLDSRYGELDEKYKILKVDVFHFAKPVAEVPDLWESIKGLLTQENNFSESDIRAMVDWYKLRDTTERNMRELNDSLATKQQKLVEKDQIISEITNQLNGREEVIKHAKEFQDKLASILNCVSEQGEILASTAIAIGNESKLANCQTEKQGILSNIDKAISEGVEKQTFELRVMIAQLQMKIAQKEKDILAYQKKIDILTLGKTVISTPIALRIKNLFDKLFKRQ